MSAGTFQRGQVRQRIVDQAAIYRRKARPIVAEWVRGDVTGAA